jgi:hypothetical protein
VAQPDTSLAAASAEERSHHDGTSTTTTVAWVAAVLLGLGVCAAVLRLDRRFSRR